MRGRKPRPTAQQISEGDPRKLGVHRLEEKLKAEVRGTRGLPKCPPHLKGIARKAWRFWSEELEKMNLDCRPDALMLEGACIGYEMAITAYEAVQKQGLLVAKRILDPETNRLVVSNVKPNPAVAQLNAALMLEKPPAEEDDLMAILSQPRDRKTQQQDQPGETIQ